MRQPVYRRFIVSLFSLTAVAVLGPVFIGGAKAQNADPNVLAAQLEQMQTELQFLRRQVDMAAGVGNTFDALVQRVVDLEVSINTTQAQVARLIELDAQRALVAELTAQRIAALEAQLASQGPTVIDEGEPILAPQPVAVASEVRDSEVVPLQNDAVELVEATADLPVPAQRSQLQPEAAELSEDAVVVVSPETVNEPTQDSPAARALGAVMEGALLNPGPIVAIVTRDAKGAIERPIPGRRPREDTDPQPWTLKAPIAEQDPVADNDTGIVATEPSAPLALIPTPENDQDQIIVVAETAPEPSTSEPLTAEQLYDVAFAHIEADDLPAAEQGFTQFLAEFPDDPLASNASYWLGESFYGRQMWTESVRAFASSVRDYRQGRKAPDSLLKLGITLGTLGQTAEACRLLAFLPVEYANAPEGVVNRAQAEAIKLNCS